MADALDIGLAEILEVEGPLVERGVLPRRPRRPRGDLLGALIAYRELCGYRPSGRDWERATPEHPPRRTYVRRFGSWRAAIHAAEKERRREKRRMRRLESLRVRTA